MNKVLVAEDDKLEREVLVKRLVKYAETTGAEISVITATSKGEALAQIAANPDIHIVMTDMRMPDKGDGNQIAAAALAKNIRVVIITGSVGDVQKDIGARCLRIVDKLDVCTFESIDQLIRDVLAA